MRDGVYARLSAALAMLRRGDKTKNNKGPVLKIDGSRKAEDGHWYPSDGGLPLSLDFSDIIYLSMQNYALKPGTRLTFNKTGKRTGCYFERVSGWTGILDFGSSPNGYVTLKDCDMSNVSEINIEDTLIIELRDLKNLNCKVTLETNQEPLSAIKIFNCHVSDTFNFLHSSQLEIKGGKLSGDLDFSNVDDIYIDSEVDISDLKSIKFNPNGKVRVESQEIQGRFGLTPKASPINSLGMSPGNDFRR